MSDFPKQLREVFAANDTNSNLRAAVIGYRRGSGGSDGGDGVESRVAKLEVGVAHIERDVAELRTDMRDVRDRLTRLEERVGHLPTKSFMVGSVLLSLAVIGGLVTFQGQVQTLVGAQPAVTTKVP